MNKKHIIVIDDDAGIKDAMQLILERAGYRVSSFSRGNELINNNFELPDLILLDRQLSGIDGLDVCRFLKEQGRTAKIPIVMISATPNVIGLAKKAGADGFLEKPFKMNSLLKMVKDLIDLQ